MIPPTDPPSTASLVFLIPLLPLLASGGIAFSILLGRTRGDAAEIGTIRLSVSAAGLVLCVLFVLDIFSFLGQMPTTVFLGTWLHSGAFRLSILFSTDTTSLLVATGAAFLSWVTVIFSIRYLHREDGFHRFFLLLGLFFSGIQLILLGGNGWMVFVGWELCGLSSYLLIGYAYTRPTATSNALFAVITNRIGDAGFLLGLIIALITIGSTDWNRLSEWAQGPTFDKVTGRLMLFGFLTAALAKSAQFPFSPWIARALEGPTPSSAIFYGSVMIHAGVWLIIRLAPVFVQVPDMLFWLTGIGLLTACYGVIIGLVQTDVKSALLFSTITQVGLLFFECGLGYFTLATWHLGLHALTRAWQFLRAPSYLQINESIDRKPWTLITVLVPFLFRQFFWTAALQRFWFDCVAFSLLVDPLRSIGEDLSIFDDQVLARIVGMPMKTPQDNRIILANGFAGSILLWSATYLQRFETRLILGDNALITRILTEAGSIFCVIEDLLEQPRYLLLIVIMTLAIIL